jgi:hypothetical protein
MLAPRYQAFKLLGSYWKLIVILVLAYAFAVQMQILPSIFSTTHSQQSTTNVSFIGENPNYFYRQIKSLALQKTTTLSPNLQSQLPIMEKIEMLALEILKKDKHWAQKIWLENGNLSQDDPLLIEYVRYFFQQKK